MDNVQLSTKPIDDRVQRMIEWLRRHQEQIRALERGKVEINFAGWEKASVKVALTIHEEA